MADNLTTDDITTGLNLPALGRDTNNNDIAIYYDPTDGLLKRAPNGDTYQIQEWEAKTYQKNPQFVTVNDETYKLKGSLTLPYVSTDFAAELAAGDWVKQGGTFDYIDFNPQSPPPSHLIGRFFYDSDENTFTAYNDLAGTSLQLGEELRARLINDTGNTLGNGVAVSVIGNVGASIKVELLDSTSLNSSLRGFGLITLEVIDGQPSYAVRYGAVRGLNTSACTSGDLIWSDPSTPGGWTNVRPKAPFYPVRLGICLISDATQGIIAVDTLAFNGSDTSLNLQGVLNGIVLDTPDVQFTVESNVLYADLTNKKHPTRNLPFVQNDIRYDLDTLTNTGLGGAARVIVPWGTSEVKANSIMYVYLDGNTPTFGIASAEPNFPYSEIGRVSTYDEAKFIELGRPFAYRRTNNTPDRDDGTHDGSYGLFTEVLWWIRSLGSAWISSQDATTTVNNTTIRLAMTAGRGRQFRRNNIPLFDGLEYQILNNALNEITYENVDNLTAITTTAGGATDDLLSNNRFYTIRLFYQLNSNGIGDSVIATRPTGFYTDADDAINDASGYAVDFNDTDIEEIIYPLYDLVIGRTGTGGSTIALIQLTDKRSKIPFGAGGGGASGSGGLDEKGRVSATDTTADYLNPKITFGDEFEKTITNPGGNEAIFTVFKGWIYNATRTFYHNIVSLATANHTATLPNKSGMIAFLDDITGGGGGLTIPSQTPIAIADAATTDIVLNNEAVFYSFADGNTTWTITVSGGSNSEVKSARRYLDNSANNSAVIITLSDANMAINEDDGNNLTLAANSKYTLDVDGLSTTEVDMLSIIPKK